MDKKIVILIHQGLPYKKTVLYGSERAREIGAKLVLLGIVPEFDESEKVVMAIQEIGPYDAIFERIEGEIVGFLENAVQFCLDNGITVETRIERGEIEEVIKRIVKDIRIRLVVVPTPTKKAHHATFLESISQFAHNMLDHELRCPVVSVLAI